MLYNVSLNVARRVVLFPLVSRSILTRSFSSTPTVAFPARSATTTQSTKSTTKSATKPKAKSTTKPATKKKIAAKPKPKVTKPKKAAKKQPATFTKDELKVPTRPGMSSFVMFTLEERKNLPPVDTRQGVQDQARELGQRWKTVDEEEKQVYRAKAAERNEELAKVYHEWLANVDSKILRAINARRKAAGKLKIHRRRDDNAKAPTPIFFKFLSEFRTQNPTLSIPESGRQAAVAWRALDPEAKKPYVDSFYAEREAYRLEQSAHNTSQQSV